MGQRDDGTAEGRMGKQIVSNIDWEGCTPYAACAITFLNREDNTKQAYCYPVTLIELRDINTNLQYRFMVGEDGRWYPTQNFTNVPRP